MNTQNKKLWTVFIIGLVIGLGYLIWLDSGCEMGGAMTWEGKQCVENLK